MSVGTKNHRFVYRRCRKQGKWYGYRYRRYEYWRFSVPTLCFKKMLFDSVDFLFSAITTVTATEESQAHY